jgi:predicted ArsR family transcriptional regulator
MKSTTQKSKLVSSLKNGSEFTANQISSRFGVVNPTALITRLRKEGFAIYANRRTNSLGETYTKYRLGSPRRHVIATGYSFWGADLSGLTK